jgi:putative aminopeptidase FrvX
MEALSLLKDYMLIPAGSGYESRMAYRLKADFERFTNDVCIDRIGNVIAHFKSELKNAPKVMLFAHMDQIGFVVTHITHDGYLRLNKNGSVPDKIVPGLALTVLTQEGNVFNAVAGEKSYHVMTIAEKESVTPIPSLFIDIGVSSDEEVLRLGIQIGDSVVYRPFFERLQGSYVTGTSIDNRGACVALMLCAEAISKIQLECDVYLVGSVQEEHNMHGAMTAANVILPDIAIALDVCLASDSPGLEETFNSATGNGPAITMYSFHGRGTLNGVIPHMGLVKLVRSAAEQSGIMHTWFASRGLLTDATYVQNVGKGVATIDLSFPVKYAHSPCEVCNMDDVVTLGRLCAATLERINGDFPLTRY